MTTVCKQDNCLQLDNTLKLLKNYLKKQILNYNFTVTKNHDLKINTDVSKLMLENEHRLFKIQTNMQKYMKNGMLKGQAQGMVNKCLYRAFNKW